jgi:KaiC/GvpD/RAD55 family RecA-like ATPase
VNKPRDFDDEVIGEHFAELELFGSGTRMELDVPLNDAREPSDADSGRWPPSEPSPASPGPSSTPAGATPAPSATPDTRRPVTLAEAFETRLARGPLVRMATGLEGIDRATMGGIPFGSTVFFVGAPDAAKTLLLFTIAIAWARRGILVGFMAVDEELDDLVTRLAQQTAKEVSMEGEVLRHFSRSDYEVGSTETITRIRKAIGELPILFFDAAWTVERATAHVADEAKRLGKRSAFFADSLQTVRSGATPEDASERRVVSDNAKALRQAAVRHGMTTLSTSESNREYSKAKRKGEAAVAMSAGAESRAVEFTARALFVLSAVEDSNLIEVEVPKNKLGPGKAFHLAIDRATQTLSDAPSPELVPKVPRSEAAAERRRVQATETAKRKASEKAEAEQWKAAEAVERNAAHDRAFVEILRANTGGVAVVDMRAKLTAKLGSLSNGAENVIAARLGDAVEKIAAPKPAHHLAKLFVLVEDKLPPHLRRPVSTTENEAAQ